MASTSVSARPQEEQRSVSVAPIPPRDAHERATVGVHGAVRRREQHAVPARPPARARDQDVHARLRSCKALGRANRRHPYARSDGARSVLRATPASIGIRRRPGRAGRTTCSMSDSRRLLGVLNIAMADTMITCWEREVPLRRRPALLAAADGDPAGGHRRQSRDTARIPTWLPLVATPSHPEYPAGPRLPHRRRASPSRSSHFGRSTGVRADDQHGHRPGRTYTDIASTRRRQERPGLGRAPLSARR